MVDCNLPLRVAIASILLSAFAASIMLLEQRVYVSWNKVFEDDLSNQDEAWIVGNEEGQSFPADGSALRKEGGGRRGELGESVGKGRGGGEAGRDCGTMRLYVYDMPEEFNVGIGRSCKHNCDSVKNFGMGPAWVDVIPDEEVGAVQKLFGNLSVWYNPLLWGMEATFHARMLQHPCITKDPEEASMFYIPYYPQLGVDLDKHTGNGSWRERPTAAVEWLQKLPYAARNSGYDHFLTLGHISYNFMIPQDWGTTWGSDIMQWPFFLNVTKLTVERPTYDGSFAGIPYPTPFYPSRDDQIDEWLLRVRRSKRRYRATFVGSRQRVFAGFKSTGNFILRSMLMDQCEEWDRCAVLDCKYKGKGEKTVCWKAHVVLHKYLQSDFCLQPVGDSATRKSVFDSMLAGCIPVFFSPNTAYTQYMWYLPMQRDSYSVYIDKDAMLNTTIKEALSRYTPKQISAMRKVLIDYIIPHVISANPMSYGLRQGRDIVDVAVEGMMTKVTRFKAGLGHTFPTPDLVANDKEEAFARIRLPSIHP